MTMRLASPHLKNAGSPKSKPLNGATNTATAPMSEPTRKSGHLITVMHTFINEARTARTIGIGLAVPIAKASNNTWMPARIV